MTVEMWLGAGVLLLFLGGMIAIEVRDHGWRQAIINILLVGVSILIMAVGVGLLVGIIDF